MTCTTSISRFSSCKLASHARCHSCFSRHRSKTNLKQSYNRNQQYSITAITDASGAVVERYAYTAYGTPTITDASGTLRTTTAIGNRYTYTGREYDETLALYHYRARMYDSVGGRFVSRDPIGYKAGKHLMRFIENSPLAKADPRGLFSVCCRPMDVPGGSFTDHCQLRNHCVPDEDDSPVWPDLNSDRRMDNGTTCANATRADIEACLRRNEHSDQPHGGPPGINNNCQSSTVDRIAKCCLSSTWSPGWPAHPKGRNMSILIFLEFREHVFRPWKCRNAPDPLPNDPPTCPPIDDFSHHGWPTQPEVEYPSTDNPDSLWPEEVRLDF